MYPTYHLEIQTDLGLNVFIFNSLEERLDLINYLHSPACALNWTYTTVFTQF